jgi:DNA-binding NarL/FixJ family response regulator
MVSIYIADASPEERSALRMMLKNLKMQVLGEAANWPALLAEVPIINPDLLLVDYGLVNAGSSDSLANLRAACSPSVTIILISNLALREQAALSTGADIFISKCDLPEDIVKQIQDAAENIQIPRMHKGLN